MKDSKQDTAQPAARQQAAVAGAPEMRPFALLAKRVGNGHMRSLMQAKLTVSNPTDIYEQEADRVADQVMRMPANAAIARTPLQIQRACCSKCEDEDKPAGLQRSAEGAHGVPAISDELESSISRLSGRGEPLPTAVRSFMESRFGADFGGVRVHADAHAHGLARAVDAQAFTVGSNVVFGAGHYAPQTDQGKRLLAHELTHVIQQAGAGASVQRQPNQPVNFGSMRFTPSAGSMARSAQVAMAHDQIDHHNAQLPEMERCMRHCQHHSTEERRWYMQAFLKHYYRNDPQANDQQLDQLLVEYERRFLQSLAPNGAAMNPHDAASMAWVDEKMQEPPTLMQASDKMSAYARWIESREYRILQRPYQQRYWQALNEYREQLGESLGGVYARLDSDHNKLVMLPLELWNYGVARDLFAPHEQPKVFGELAKEVAATYKYRYFGAIAHARLTGDLDRRPRADEVFRAGYADHLFLKEEEQQVLAERTQDLKEFEAQRAERDKYLRRKSEADRYQAWVAQGERLSAAEPFIQPFAMAGLGWFVGAAYGGASTGMLGVQTYQACVQGQGNCADAVVQVGVGVATHYATKGLSEPSAPRQPARVVPEPVAPERVVTEPTATAKAPKTATATTTAPIPKPTPKDFEIEGPTHPELFPESEKTFEMDPLPGSHIDDPGDLIENLPEIEHPPDVKPGTRPTRKPDLPPDDSPGDEPVEIEVPEKGQQASAIRGGSSRGRVVIQVGGPGRARQVLPAARAETREVADFTLLGWRRVRAKIGLRPDPGKILHWRIRAATRNRSTLAAKDVGPLLEALLSDAHHAEAAVLRVSGKLQPKQDFNSLQKLARLLGGDAHALDAENTEIEIPVPHPAKPRAPHTPQTPTPAARPGRPVQQQEQQQQQRMGPSREDPTRPETPRAKQAAAAQQPHDQTGLGPIRKAIVYVTGKGANRKYRAIVVVGKKAYYQATGTSKSDIAGLPQYKTPGQWHHFLGIQEFTTELEWILKLYKGAGRRGWVIKGKGISDMAPLRSLENSPLEIEFETSVPERVNEWLFNQGADSHIAVEHAGMLDPIEES